MTDRTPGNDGVSNLLTATSIKNWWLGANPRSGMRYENAVIGSPREVESG